MKQDILVKIKNDFLKCREKVEKNYNQCRPIYVEKNDFKAKEWTEKKPGLQ